MLENSEVMDLPRFEKHGYSDHHAILPHKVKKTIWLHDDYFFRLRQITCQGKNHDTNYLINIIKVRTADAQYALLMHFHKMAGTIQRPPAARKYNRITAEDRAKASSMFAEGHTITEISKELNHSKTTISNMVTDTPLRKHDKLSRDEIKRIYALNKCGTSLSQIARKLGRQVSTIKYQVDKIKNLQLDKVCMTCNGKVEGFDSDLSQKEFLISGICQTCQDSVLNVDDDL